MLTNNGWESRPHPSQSLPGFEFDHNDLAELDGEGPLLPSAGCQKLHALTHRPAADFEQLAKANLGVRTRLLAVGMHICLLTCGGLQGDLLP